MCNLKRDASSLEKSTHRNQGAGGKLKCHQYASEIISYQRRAKQAGSMREGKGDLMGYESFSHYSHCNNVIYIQSTQSILDPNIIYLILT